MVKQRTSTPQVIFASQGLMIGIIIIGIIELIMVGTPLLDPRIKYIVIVFKYKSSITFPY